MAYLGFTYEIPTGSIEFKNYGAGSGTTEAVLTTDEVKAHLRIVFADHDTELTRLINASQTAVMRHTSQALIVSSWTYRFEFLPSSNRVGLHIPHAPLSDITAIRYKDSNGDDQTIEPTTIVKRQSAGFTPQYTRLFARDDWPQNADVSNLQPLEIDAVAGKTEWDDTIKSACLFIIEQWYDAKAEGMEMPKAARDLLAPYQTSQAWLTI